ncbi:hypothetical protein SOVF_006220 [Spinacia oleracea]|nr:hypothetical protein SOVF_006220 [Spinacia oleracea]
MSLYRSKPCFDEGSRYLDHVKGRPFSSYDVAHGTRTYDTRVKSHGATGYDYPTNHGRPREVEDFITQILDEVNEPSGFATGQNIGPNPNWGRHSNPVQVYPTIDYGSDYYPYGHEDRSPGLVYDQFPHGISMKAKAHRDYQVPKKWDRSPHFVDNPWSQYKSPETQWNPIYGGFSDGRGNFIEKPRYHNSYEIPDNRWDWLSSYDQPPPNGNVGMPYNNQVDGTARYMYDHPLPNGNAGGVPNSRWGMKPESHKSYGVPSQHQYRSSIPIFDHSNHPGGASSRLGNSLMEPQYPMVHGISNNQWDRTSSPDYDYLPPTNNIRGVDSNRWGTDDEDDDDDDDDDDDVVKEIEGLSQDHPPAPPTRKTDKHYGVPKQSSFGGDQYHSAIIEVPLSHPPVKPPHSPTRNTNIQVPNSRFSNSSVNPQQYGSTLLDIEEAMPQLKIATARSPHYLNSADKHLNGLLL